MKPETYRIYMDGIDDLEDGWYCGGGVRCNDMFHRTQQKIDADVFDDFNALLFCVRFRKLGYPCKVLPKISNKRQLEILAIE